MKYLLLLLFALIGDASGAYYKPFPGFDKMYTDAKFVGVVTLVRRDVPKDEKVALGDMYGPHRFFEIKSLIVFKGSTIQGEVARIADRRITDGIENHIRPPFEDILIPEKEFLVFLNEELDKGSRYQWDELHVEGAILPVSSKTKLTGVDVQKPSVFFKQVIDDYVIYCKELLDHAVEQQRLVNRISESGPRE